MFSSCQIKRFVILCCWLLFSSISAQNLVKNPSLEDFVNCPEKLGNFHTDVSFWSTPTIGSTDYFNGCSKVMGTPNNFNGAQAADFGKGYAGLYLYAPDDYREYLQAELYETPVKGKKYKISFHVSLAERSDFAIKEFGVLFSRNKLKVPIRKELSKYHIYRQKDYDYNMLEIGYTNFYSDTRDWIMVHSEFVAKGTEKYLILGNFKNNARTRLFKTKRNAKQGAYYYVDMVSVEALEKVEADQGILVSDITVGKDSFELGKIHVFQNVLFDFDKFQLTASAKRELQKIYDYLQSDTSLKITINGHTDNIGSYGYNQKLSEARAKAVADYLVKLGLIDDQINWKGHGGIAPISENTTEEGRRKNRRVAFVIKKD